MTPMQSDRRPPRRIERAVWLGLSGIGLGLSVLLVYAWIEVINNPGTTIVDGYWIGRLPWTPIGVLLVIGGASLTLVAAAAAIGVRGDWVRRVLLLPVLAAPVLWWATALGLIPFARFEAPDAVTLAYSLPQGAVLLLILPAVAAALLALLPISSDLRVRIRPVHAPGDDAKDRPN